MDFAFCNITFDIKQLVEVLRCDLQVTIQEGLMETQTELHETVVSFIDHFQTEMITLSPPQMHALLDHLCIRQAGGQVLLDAIHQGNTLTQPESFLDKGLSHLLQSFFDALPDHQVTIKKGSTVPTQLEVKVNNAATDVCANPTLMLNLEPTIIGVTTINLTRDEAIIKYPPERLLQPREMTRTQLKSFLTMPLAFKMSHSPVQPHHFPVPLHPQSLDQSQVSHTHL